MKRGIEGVMTLRANGLSMCKGVMLQCRLPEHESEQWGMSGDGRWWEVLSPTSKKGLVLGW